jgi:hypothetical protein
VIGIVHGPCEWKFPAITEQVIAHGLFADVEIKSGKSREDMIRDDELTPPGRSHFGKVLKQYNGALVSRLGESCQDRSEGRGQVSPCGYCRNSRLNTGARRCLSRATLCASCYLQFQLLTLSPFPILIIRHLQNVGEGQSLSSVPYGFSKENPTGYVITFLPSYLPIIADTKKGIYLTAPALPVGQPVPLGM